MTSVCKLRIAKKIGTRACTPNSSIFFFPFLFLLYSLSRYVSHPHSLSLSLRSRRTNYIWRPTSTSHGSTWSYGNRVDTTCTKNIFCPCDCLMRQQTSPRAIALRCSCRTSPSCTGLHGDADLTWPRTPNPSACLSHKSLSNNSQRLTCSCHRSNVQLRASIVQRPGCDTKLHHIGKSRACRASNSHLPPRSQRRRA